MDEQCLGKEVKLPSVRNLGCKPSCRRRMRVVYMATFGHVHVVHQELFMHALPA